MDTMDLALKIRERRDLLVGLENDLTNRGTVPEVGLTTLPRLNAKLWGFPKGLTVVGSRTSHGKTSFVTQLALDFGIQGINTMYLSLEDTEESLVERMFCNKYKINNFSLLRGEFNYSDSIKLGWESFKKEFIDWKLKITCGIGKTMGEVNEYINRMPSKPKVVILDYIQMTRAGKHERESLSEYIREFRELMLVNNIRGIMCSQINRESEKHGQPSKKPTLDKLKGTGSLEENAELVLLCYWDYFYSNNEENKHNYEILIAKNKKGPTGFYSLLYFPEHYRFEEKERETVLPIREVVV